jgi:hypothetical protein
MDDPELRQYLLFFCNLLKDHLEQTRKLESVVEVLLERDPVAKARYEEEARKELATSDQDDDVTPRSTSEMLLQVASEIRRLTPRNFREQG